MNECNNEKKENNFINIYIHRMLFNVSRLLAKKKKLKNIIIN